MNELQTKRQLLETERQLCMRMQDQRLQGRRDELVRQLCDNEGAHDQRKVGVR